LKTGKSLSLSHKNENDKKLQRFQLMQELKWKKKKEVELSGMIFKKQESERKEETGNRTKKDPA